jgi:hypothetical protein
LELLEQISELSKKAKKDVNFDSMIRLLELRLEIDQKLKKKNDEEINLTQIVGVCTEV